MKVILLTDQFIQSNDTFVIGGWIQSLINILKESGNMQIAVAGLTSAGSSTQNENGTVYYRIKQQYGLLKRIYLRWKCAVQDPEIIDEYIAAINHFNPDIVHIFGVENFLCNVVPHIKPKVVVHLQGLTVPYLNSWFPPGISLGLLKRNSISLFNFLRGLGFQQQYKIFAARARSEAGYFHTLRFVMGRTDWDRTIASILGNNITYFHLEESLRPNFYTAPQWKVKKHDEHTEFQFVSVLSPATYKGFDVILKTASILKSKGFRFQWNIYGISASNSVAKAMQRIVKTKYSQCSVSFAGKKTAQELVELLLNADVFIHPSYIENSPNSICEAQMLGLPVVATNVGGVSSLIENNRTGILSPANDIYYMAGKISALLGSPETMQQLGNNARIAATQRHNRENILKNLENIYRQVIQTN